MTSRKVKLINGPLHGLEIEPEHGGSQMDFLDSKDGKVRRYERGNFAFFVREWNSKEEYDKEHEEKHLFTPGTIYGQPGTSCIRCGHMEDTVAHKG